MHIYLCLKLVVSLSQCFERDCFLNKIEKGTNKLYNAFKMQANTICIQSIHVRSRLILISVTCDVTVQNSVLILRDLFAKNQPTKMQNNTKCIQPINIRSRLILIKCHCAEFGFSFKRFYSRCFSL